jgi:hypothetical protein
MCTLLEDMGDRVAVSGGAHWKGVSINPETTIPLG